MVHKCIRTGEECVKDSCEECFIITDYSTEKKKTKNIQDTSIESYRKLQRNLAEKQQIMLQFFREHPGLKFSNRHLANNLGWPINTVTPRCKELRELGYVVEAGRIFDVTTQRHVLTWKLKR